MLNKIQVVKNVYHDSVTLMLLSKEITKIEGIKSAAVMMGTSQNKNLLINAGMLKADFSDGDSNDLVIAIQGEFEDAIELAMQKIKQFLNKSDVKDESSEITFNSLDSALQHLPEANLAIISVPGYYAKREAMRALKKGLHVQLFSDNVTIEDEIELKELAKDKGLLMMGPDCGTSIINGVGLGFANNVKRGKIGVVAAAGTGLQEVVVLIAKSGEGISQAIGTGGRDIKDSVGGIMMIEGIKALLQDENSQVIVIISKPPGKGVFRKVMEVLTFSSKPVVVCMLGSSSTEIKKLGGIPAFTLEDAANTAVNILRGCELKRVLFTKEDSEIKKIVAAEVRKLRTHQKYVRGIYTGGTLCYEAMLVLEDYIEEIHSNVPLTMDCKLENSNISKNNALIDMGEDEFTAGRPHPMIDPTLRDRRIIEEASDPETAVILLDMVLGYGAHPNPAGALMSSILKAKQIAGDKGRYISFIASICGTEDDPQVLSKQEAGLKEAGVIVMPSNSQAARLAGLIVTKGRNFNEALEVK